MHMFIGLVARMVNAMVASSSPVGGSMMLQKGSTEIGGHLEGVLGSEAELSDLG